MALELPHGLGGLRGELAVVLGVAVAELPGPVHLVAQAPHLHPVGLGVPVGDAGVRQRRARADVGVLQHVDGLEHAAGAQVDRVHQLAADLLDPARELVQPDLVGLGRVPRQVQPGGPLVPRAHGVLPAEAGDEVATRVADGGDTELADQLDHVGPEALGVGGRVSGLVDPVVDAAAQVLDERAEDAAGDGADGEVRVERELSGGHVVLFDGFGSSDDGRITL